MEIKKIKKSDIEKAFKKVFDCDIEITNDEFRGDRWIDIEFESNNICSFMLSSLVEISSILSIDLSLFEVVGIECLQACFWIRDCEVI